MSLRVELDKELEKRFRETAMKRFGYSKGAIKKASSYAIRKWLEESSREQETRKISGKKFVEDFISLPKNKLKKSIDIKKIIEEEYEVR